MEMDLLLGAISQELSTDSLSDPEEDINDDISVDSVEDKVKVESGK